MTDADTWNDIRQTIPAPARCRAGALVHAQAMPLASLFYRHILGDPQLSPLIDHELVNQRLSASLVAWLRELFDTDTPAETLSRTQRRVGEVHARIGVSHLHVATAGRMLKRAIAALLRADAADTAVDDAAAVQYVYEVIDLAMDAMADSMGSAATRMARSDESYRLHTLTQNLRAERERQRTHLVEWLQELLVKHYWEEPKPASRPQQAASHFELWVEHKARMMFDDTTEFLALSERMRRINQELLPRLRESRDDPTQARNIVAAMHEEAAAMKLLLGTLFDRASAADDGRDTLTQLLNRRYLPSIVKREIGLSQAGGQPFSLLLLDIDRFSDIAVTLGASAADGVLAQIADALNNSVRASDFVFRVGDDQFAILLVDSSREAASEVAEGLRHAVEGLMVRSPLALAPQLTISAGVATFEGHPDYEHLLRRVESALDRAKRDGGNRVAVAPGDA